MQRVYVSFIDFEKAFHSVDRETVKGTLWNPPKYINIIKILLYRDVQCNRFFL